MKVTFTYGEEETHTMAQALKQSASDRGEFFKGRE